MPPVTTLFMLMSLDGKISTGASDDRDFDVDLPTVAGVSRGLDQYYRLEQATDSYSLNTGRVLAKVGWNDEKSDITRLPVSFIVIDSVHLTTGGVRNLLERTEHLLIVTTNSSHPALHILDPRLDVLELHGEIDFRALFLLLAQRGVQHLTVQSGGALNAVLVRAGLIDFVSVVVAPVLVGGRSTPTLVDGDPLIGENDLHLLRPLRLLSVDQLDHSYLHLRYAVEALLIEPLLIEPHGRG